MHIRPAQVSDAEQLLAIYAYYVKNTAISFEYAVLRVLKRFKTVSERL